MKENIQIENKNLIENITTHDGPFHTDEVFSTAIFKDLFPEKIEKSDGTVEDNIKYLRTRNSDIVKEKINSPNSLLHDLGGVYNPEMYIYDHHQKEGAGARENGIKYATAGLVWQKFGKEWISYVDSHKRKLHLTEEEKNLVWKKIDEKLVSFIDANDTGQIEDVRYKLKDHGDIHGMNFTLPEVVRLLNVNTSDEKIEDNDKMFCDAVELFRKLILAALYREFTLVEGLRSFDKSKCKFLNEGKALLIEEGASPLVTNYLFFESNDPDFEKVEFLASKNHNGEYGVIAVPIQEGIREYRNPNMIPKEIRLVNDTEKMNKILGIDNGVIFTHAGGFFAALKNKETAEKFLNYCVNY